MNYGDDSKAVRYLGLHEKAFAALPPAERSQAYVTVILADVERELRKARERFAPQNSAHEGYAVILEELDELWDAIKHNEGKERIRSEAIQVAAMAVRFVLDVCDSTAEGTGR